MPTHFARRSLYSADVRTTFFCAIGPFRLPLGHGHVHELALAKNRGRGLRSAELTGATIVLQVDGENLFHDTAAEIFGLDWEHDLDAAIEITRHPVGAT